MWLKHLFDKVCHLSGMKHTVKPASYLNIPIVCNTDMEVWFPIGSLTNTSLWIFLLRHTLDLGRTCYWLTMSTVLAVHGSSAAHCRIARNRNLSFLLPWSPLLCVDSTPGHILDYTHVISYTYGTNAVKFPTKCEKYTFYNVFFILLTDVTLFHLTQLKTFFPCLLDHKHIRPRWRMYPCLSNKHPWAVFFKVVWKILLNLHPI